jgi:hypothetical protein
VALPLPFVTPSDLGEDQRFAYDAIVSPRIQIRSGSAVRAIVTGIAGSGKTQLVQAIKTNLGNKCRVLAKTAAASFMAFGRPLSSLLNIGKDHNYKRELTERERHMLLEDMQHVSCLLIDEYSMFVLTIFDGCYFPVLQTFITIRFIIYLLFLM